MINLKRVDVKVWHGLGEIDVPPNVSTAVTLGNFDGVHRGHHYLLSNLIEKAHNNNVSSVVVTFDPHPAVVHRPEHEFDSIMGLSQRLAAFERLGIDYVLVIEYSLEFAEQTPEEFVRNIFVDSLHAKYIIAGYDTRFGRDNSGGSETLEALASEYDFEAVTIRDLKYSRNDIQVLEEIEQKIALDNHEYPPKLTQTSQYCSSVIRTLISHGYVDTANSHLGHQHEIIGTVVHGLGRGRKLGFPTANIEVSEGLVPSDGVYAGFITYNDNDTEKTDKTTTAAVAISVGTNPTFSDVSDKQVEAYVIGRPDDEKPEDFDLYDKKVSVKFVKKIRDMQAFSSQAELVMQIKDDVSNSLEILSQYDY